MSVHKGARKQVLLRLRPSLIARIDRMKGDVNRNEYLTKVIETHVNREEIVRSRRAIIQSQEQETE